MIFDGHTDLLYDVTRRRLAGERAVLEGRWLPRLRAGGVEGAVLALWTDTGGGRTFWTGTAWADPAESRGRTETMLREGSEDLAESPGFCRVETVAQAETARAAGRLYAFLAVEGMDAIGADPAGVDRYYRQGVRLGMLTWNGENALASGAACAGGLKPAGRAVLRRMERLGMVIDVSHINEEGFWDVLDTVHGPVIASHSNAKALCDVPRNLTDGQLRAIRDTGGLVGLNTHHAFVHRDPAGQTVAALARHAAHMAEVMGVECVACGFDYCGFMGPGNDSARGIGRVEESGSLLAALADLGMTAAEREMIARGNLLRVLGKVLG